MTFLRSPAARAAVGVVLAALLSSGCSAARSPDHEPEPVPGTTVPRPAGEPATSWPSPDGAIAASPGSLEPSPPFERSSVTLRGPDGSRLDLEVYVAADPETRQRGLMHREHLPAGTGMVFLFPEDTEGGFWMRDTLIPLDIAFADASGAVLTVLTMEPCEADPCPSYDPETTYRTALETNAGELVGRGVGPGWQLELPGHLRP